MKLAACYTVFNGIELLSDAIESVKSEVDEIIISYQLVSNYGNIYDEFLYWKDKHPQYTYIEFNPDLSVDAKTNEKRKHQGLIEKARELGCTHFFLSATDHLYVTKELQYAKKKVESDNLVTTYTKMKTYFKSNDMCLAPYESYYMPFICSVRVNMGTKAPVLVDPACMFRPFNPSYVFDAEEVLMHHFSWLRHDISSKLENAAAKVNWLDRVEEFKEKYNNFKLGDKFPYYPNHEIVKCKPIFKIRTFFKTKN
jgi:hypothetical protein